MSGSIASRTEQLAKFLCAGIKGEGGASRSGRRPRPALSLSAHARETAGVGLRLLARLRAWVPAASFARTSLEKSRDEESPARRSAPVQTWQALLS